MKKLIHLVIILIILSGCTVTSNVINIDSIDTNIYFCPKDMCLEKILEKINSSDDIKCAFYDLNIPILIKKLKEKNADVIIENDNALDEFSTGYSSALMHNKFCIFDSKSILTGSMNPTIRGNYYNNNNIIFINSKKLAKNYLDEFNELKKNIYGKGEKTKNNVIITEDIVVENYFCPEDNCKLQVIKNLDSAKKSIHFMTFSFTDEDIGNLLYNKNYLGLDVKGIVEKRQISKYSRYDDLKDITKIDDNPYTMHHKVFIIDQETVITGSYNPTKNANENNDENILIIHNKKIAQQYINEFNTLYNHNISIPKTAFPLLFSEIMYDAEGKDEGNEYIKLTNIGNENIILDYYFLSNNVSNQKLAGIIKPNQTIKINPTFNLKNSDGILILKKNNEFKDITYWNGIWDINAKNGKILQRIDNKINENSWTNN